MAIDNLGNYWVASANQDRVFKIDPTGFLTSPAALTQVPAQGIAVDAAGNVYVSEGCAIIKFIPSTGKASLFAGVPASCGYNGDNIPATQALLYGVAGMAFDRFGSLFVADSFNQRIRVIQTDGIISTVVGNGTQGFADDTGPIFAELSNPKGVAFDATGNLYVADTANSRIRFVQTFGTHGAFNLIVSVAGSSTAGYSGDGGLATSAELRFPTAVSIDPSGRIFFADSENNVIREFQVGGVIQTVAGNFAGGSSSFGGPATSTFLGPVSSVTVDASDHMIISAGNYLSKAPLGGNISVVAGNGKCCFSGNDIPAVDASLSGATSATHDNSGYVFISDSSNCIIRRVNNNGIILTVAGIPEDCGDDFLPGGANGTTLRNPTKALMDHLGNPYIADTCLIWKSAAITNAKTRFAGTGNCGFSGDNGPAVNALLAGAFGIALDNAGDLYVADSGNQRVRKVNTAGTITTVAGDGVQGFAGDGGAATHAALNMPNDVAVDALGNLYIADSGNNRIRVVSNGKIHTFAGNGGTTYNASGVPATQSSLLNPRGVAVDAAGDVIIADTNVQRVAWVDGGGILYTLAGLGNGSPGFSGDGGLATRAELDYPIGVAADVLGNVYIAEPVFAGTGGQSRIRKVSAIANLNASASSLNFGSETTGKISAARAVTLTSIGPLEISSISVSGDFTYADHCPTRPSSDSSCIVDVFFKPTATGTRIGSLTIHTDGYFNKILTVHLTGTGD
jgi:sugar lactone lactonase YvrE